MQARTKDKYNFFKEVLVIWVVFSYVMLYVPSTFVANDWVYSKDKLRVVAPEVKIETCLVAGEIPP